jgi:hypothetical protein
MTTLDEAWAWYGAAREGMKLLTHLAKFRDELPWGQGADWVARLERDNVLKHVSATEMAAGAELVKADIDDLAVLVLFSVFEAVVRDRVEAEVKPEVDGLRHPALKTAGEDVLQAVAEGSFFRVLEPYKSQASSDLVEQVNQVRKYRNWVAHGRRPDHKPDAAIEPREAYRRLKAFLDVVRPPAAVGLPSDS